MVMPVPLKLIVFEHLFFKRKHLCYCFDIQISSGTVREGYLLPGEYYFKKVAASVSFLLLTWARCSYIIFQEQRFCQCPAKEEGNP